MSLHVDYLISGAGAMGMAFADVILHESGKTIALVDRRAAPTVIGMMLTRLFDCIDQAHFTALIRAHSATKTNRRRFTYITGNEEGFTYTYEAIVNWVDGRKS